MRGDLRTPQEEHIMQGDWSREAAAQYRVRRGYWQGINFAQKTATRLLDKLRSIDESKGWKEALRFAGATDHWQAQIVLLGVLPTHRDFCLQLFQAAAYERFNARIQQSVQG